MCSMLTDVLPDNPRARGATVWHLNTHPAITIDGDGATEFTFWMYVRRGETNVALLATLGGYEDELIRENGRSRFRGLRDRDLHP
jgi:hypothetical protein